MSTPLKFKDLLGAAARVLRRPIWLPRQFVELRCAHRLDRMGLRLLRMRTRIDAMSAHLDSGALDGPSGGPLPRLAADRDGNLRRMLAGLREELATMRRELARWHLQECGGHTGRLLGRALARVNGIVVDTSAAALALEARLDAHDGAPTQ
jgi:hypothetical protein